MGIDKPLTSEEVPQIRFTDQVSELCNALNTLGVPVEFVSHARNLLLTSGEDIDLWLELATELRKHQYYHEGLLVYDMAMQCFPNNKRILSNRGILLFKWGRLEEALQSFEQAIALDSSYVRALEGRADTYLAMQNFLNAAKGYSEILNNNPDHSQCWNKLGNCLREIGQREEAKVAYEQAIHLDPVYTEPLFNLAGLLYEDRNFTQALEVVSRLLAIDPDDDGAQQLKREILQRPISPTKLKPSFQRDPQTLLFRPFYGIANKKETPTVPAKNKPPIVDLSTISRMSRNDDEVAYLGGYKMWDRAHLIELVHAGIDKIPPPPSKPLSLFISYRWGDEGQNAWVSSFSSDLKARGYNVVFDRQAQTTSPMPVPEMVALLLKCNLFVPILTEPYRRRIEIGPNSSMLLEDGWVFDEFYIASYLNRIGRLKFTGIWRSGPVVPSPFRPDTVIDFRDDASYSQLMNKIFPPRMAIIVGYRYDGTQHMMGPIERIRVEEVEHTLQESGEFESFRIIHL